MRSGGVRDMSWETGNWAVRGAADVNRVVKGKWIVGEVGKGTVEKEAARCVVPS